MPKRKTLAEVNAQIRETREKLPIDPESVRVSDLEAKGFKITENPLHLAIKKKVKQIPRPLRKFIRMCSPEFRKEYDADTGLSSSFSPPLPPPPPAPRG